MDSPPPPPPPPLPIEPLSSADRQQHSPAPSPSLPLSPSLFIIAAIIVVVVAASFSIHLLLRFLSCRRRTSSAVAALPLPLTRSRSALGSSPSPSASAADSALSDRENAALIDSLPVFTLASALASLPKSSPDCAVCLCPFRPHDQLRLLPACCHAFHSSCVDPWLQITSSCPLCRASISLPCPALPPPPPPVAGERESSRSGSFRIEIGSVSRRRTLSGEEPGNPPPPPLPASQLRTYSIGSSFEYLVEEEVEAVVGRIVRRTENAEKRGDADAAPNAAPAPPGEWVAEAAGRGGGGGLGWLKEYVDRLASSASSSFSSRRLSGRWSHRYDGDGVGGRNSWDLEGAARREAEEGGYYGFYRWLTGA